MNRRQLNRLAMFGAVLTHLDAYPHLWQDHRPLAETVGTYREPLAEVEAEARVQQDPLPLGITQTKHAQRRQMEDLLLALSARLVAYAHSTDERALYRVLDYTPGAVRHANEAAFLALCETVQGRAAERLAHLADYGVTQDDLDALRVGMDTYQAMTRRRTAERSRRVHATARLAALFEELRAHLRLLDRLMPAYVTDRDFLGTYAQARKILGR